MVRSSFCCLSRAIGLGQRHGAQVAVDRGRGRRRSRLSASFRRRRACTGSSRAGRRGSWRRSSRAGSRRVTRKPAACSSASTFCGVVVELLADRQDADLLGGQPERERAGEVLDQDAHEPLHASRTGRGGSSPAGAAGCRRRCTPARTARAGCSRAARCRAATRGRCSRGPRSRPSGRRTPPRPAPSS